MDAKLDDSSPVNCGSEDLLLSNSYSTVARDLSLKTIPRPRAQPEGEQLFSMMNPMATVL